jgi:hypothetical protein
MLVIQLKVNCQVHVYSFSETRACSEIGEQHYNLPVHRISNNPLSMNEFLKADSPGAGNASDSLNFKTHTSHPSTASLLSLYPMHFLLSLYLIGAYWCHGVYSHDGVTVSEPSGFTCSCRWCIY